MIGHSPYRAFGDAVVFKQTPCQGLGVGNHDVSAVAHQRDGDTFATVGGFLVAIRRRSIFIFFIYDGSVSHPATPFRSLRFRLLAPVMVAALVAAVVVAMGSYWLGDRRAERELSQRFDGIQRSLAESTFPLNRVVLDLLADLTQTQLVGIDSSGNVTDSTIELVENARLDYRILAFSTRNQTQRADRVAKIEVLFDKQQIEASRRRAAILPLATGLSTILVLSTITLIVSSRLVGRVNKLHRRVELVAAGDFESKVSDQVDDEIGRLGSAVDTMATELRQLWNQVNHQQSEKLLHQIAGGMAHQLRNSLTGARMAVELHAKQCESADDEGIGVAIHQIEVAEDYVRRLLLVASGNQDDDRPMSIHQCFEDVRRSLSPLAKHLQVDMSWRVVDLEANDSTSQYLVSDGPSWMAAASNLIHNAIEAGDRIDVALTIDDAGCHRLTVADNGAGISETIADELFEPFVTSKPEGMGLGLSVVQRAAERLGGEVRWRRKEDQTIFELESKTMISLDSK
ncbi:Sporulation kinase A [Rubripirellula obstinata]|uniref:histidine kinase n=2 Tax=Rubripirellula obstinata TaxID=406547 RepID=A0A5B1CHW4_9BACT|nr:HAMP domain-containing sensor histidine kinase [Rubripirellula obstinata]KAA1258844.1 Sporulation kinase A [Rubripirellula obstinata]